jgi:hypothetical protein
MKFVFLNEIFLIAIFFIYWEVTKSIILALIYVF